MRSVTQNRGFEIIAVPACPPDELQPPCCVCGDDGEQALVVFILCRHNGLVGRVCDECAICGPEELRARMRRRIQFFEDYSEMMDELSAHLEEAVVSEIILPPVGDIARAGPAAEHILEGEVNNETAP